MLLARQTDSFCLICFSNHSLRNSPKILGVGTFLLVLGIFFPLDALVCKLWGENREGSQIE